MWHIYRLRKKMALKVQMHIVTSKVVGYTNLIPALVCVVCNKNPFQNHKLTNLITFVKLA